MFEVILFPKVTLRKVLCQKSIWRSHYNEMKSSRFRVTLSRKRVLFLWVDAEEPDVILRIELYRKSRLVVRTDVDDWHTQVS